jgi:hypothetical protein
MAGAVLVAAMPGFEVGPTNAQTDNAVGPDFERFDGLSQPPLQNAPAPKDGRLRFIAPGGPRPGQADTTEQTYTPGPISGVVGTVDGQPLTVGDRLHREPGGYTPSKTPSIQRRLGVGQAGPSALGADQTVFLSEITSNPPIPGDLTSIIAGLA